ncbi:MAG TPA: DUF5654 family protein [archaeon]|nr:DUF5654 family protein [archaeon]
MTRKSYIELQKCHSFSAPSSPSQASYPNTDVVFILLFRYYFGILFYIRTRKLNVEVNLFMALNSEVIDKIAALITAAFGLVAALAWNGAILAIFQQIFGEATSVPAMVIYAVVVTIIAVIATIWIGRAAAKSKGA